MTQVTDTSDYIKRLNDRRKKQRMIGWGGVGLGILTYLDAGWKFPIWLTGIWAFGLGTIFIVIGLIFLSSSYKLPIREALMFASTKQGMLTAPSLALGLNVTLETAELIIDQLAKKGYARVSDEDMEEGVVVYKITGIEKL
jgi:hypothetical protein